MIGRMLSLVVILVAAGLMLFAGTPSARADVSCVGTVGGASQVTNINGNVTVPSASSCTLNFVNVSGSVVVGSGATLLIAGYAEPSTIAGDVIATHCDTVLLQGNITVGGSVQISFCNGNGPNGFQGPDTVIKGNFTCQSNQSQGAPCLAWLGKVSGNVTVSSNTAVAAPEVSLVAIGGKLDCEANSPAPIRAHGPSWVDGGSLGQCSGFATTTTSISNGQVTPAASCAALASLPIAGFPVPNTVIDSAVDTPATSSLPERCIVNGHINAHTSPVDLCTYQSRFQVQLPLPASWNGRFMMQGGGGTEGSVPTATGTIGGSSGITEVANGYAIASQDGGHENTDLANCVKVNPNTFGNVNQFYLDPLGTIGQAYQSIEMTALTAKYLINQFYGKGPNRSYWVGCSTGGRQGMAMSQNFPSFFDGIVAGDPVYNQEALGMSEINGVEQILNVYLTNPALTPPGPTMIPLAAPAPAGPHLFPAFPTSDQALLETALLQACDALDGVTDGVVDNVPACAARFNPATATYTDYTGALGPANTTYQLQCTGAKNATCLSAAQIQAAMKTNIGPRTSSGAVIHAPAGAVAPDPVTNISQGYIWDGGWMTTVGIPSRKIGTSAATSLPGDFSLGVGTFGYAFISPADPTYYALSFNFDTDQGKLSTNTPIVTYSTSLDISHFVNYGHKIIWYHGASDPGPPMLGTKLYYLEMADQFGGFPEAQNFSRFYTVPNMGHCVGGATTDGFDFLTPMVNWVENGASPGPVASTGTTFNATTYQVVGDYITDSFVKAPTTRTRLLCPYPQQARFTGKISFASGVPVATNSSDLASAANYTCMNFVPVATHDISGDAVSDIAWRNNNGTTVAWLMSAGKLLQSGNFGQVPTNWSLLGQRDFNGDGKADWLWRDATTGTIAVWLMNGLQVQQAGSLGAVPANWSIQGTSDFNGDGKGGILFRDSNTGTVAIWLLDGLQVAHTGSLGVVPSNWIVAAVDGQGKVVWRDSNTGVVAIWMVGGLQVVQTASLGAVPSNWTIVGVGDFDGNGSTDILWRDTSTGAVAIWLMNGLAVMQVGSLGAVPSNWILAETGDFNADGKSDLLWRDTSGGTAAIWFMNGLTINSTGVLGVVTTDWTIQGANAN